MIEELNIPDSKSKTRQSMKQFFDGRMIVVDEVHNIRI